MVVAHNLQAANSSRMYKLTLNGISKDIEKLSSGYRINRAADDAAGLAISEKMRAQIRGLNRASTNAMDGISAIQVAEGALGEIQSMLHRINELCTQAANDTNTEHDRAHIQSEIDQLVLEIEDGTVNTTNFNTRFLLRGKNFRDDSGNEDLSLPGKDGQLTFWETKKGSIDQAGASTQGGGGMTSFDDNGKLNFGGVSFTSTMSCFGYGMTLDGTQPGYDRFINTAFLDGATIQIDKSDGTAKQYVYVRGGAGLDPWATGTSHMNFGEAKDFVDKYCNPENAAKGMAEIHFYDSMESLIMGVKADFGKELKSFTYSQNSDGTYNVNMSAWSDVNQPLELTLQVGALAGQTITLSFEHPNARNLGINGLSVDNHLDAGQSMKKAQDAIDKISTMRAKLGAQQNRLEHTIANLDNTAENTAAAESRIRDADMAKLMVSYSKNQILSQAGQAMLSQANASTQGVLSLLY